MSMHKLTAGSGYDYLTRQVAALDATEKGHTGLASYYTERGETPGVWIGSGMDGIDGLSVGDPVTAEQMRALFGCGLHPLAELRQQQLEGPDLTRRDFQDAARLGAPFKIVDGEVSPFRLEVARRFAAIQTAAGLPAGAALPAADRAGVRTQVAREFFLSEHGREPVDARELAGQIAKDSRPRTQTVAGYDLTFSPVKSVSTLWAVADPKVAAVIDQAHQAAVRDALAFVEKHALFTRTGPQGIRQVNVRGLVAAAFTHRDSRAGDPDLHTHVAVANKVQAIDGRWLSIDGRVLFKANVAASETYNTALEQHLREALGVRFAERAGTDPAKQPIREIVGVHPRLNQRWSTRRAHINTRRSELAFQFQQDHGRPPTPVEALQLAQQATLETRDAKHEPRSQTEQRATWLNEAAAMLGGRAAVAAMVQTALTPPAETTRIVDARWVAQTADHILSVMEAGRSTWQMWHVRAEAQRQVRTADLPIERAGVLVDLLVDDVLDRRCVALVPPRDGIEEPDVLRRTDGSSVYTVAGADLYTSQRILDAEQRLVATAGRGDGPVVEHVMKPGAQEQGHRQLLVGVVCQPSPPIRAVLGCDSRRGLLTNHRGGGITWSEAARADAPSSVAGSSDGLALTRAAGVGASAAMPSGAGVDVSIGDPPTTASAATPASTTPTARAARPGPSRPDGSGTSSAIRQPRSMKTFFVSV